MKFAVLALLGLVACDDNVASDTTAAATTTDANTHKKVKGRNGDGWEPTDAQKKIFYKLFMEDATKMFELPQGKTRMMWQRWMRGDMQDEMRMMRRHMYSKGGPWDKFAGEDGIMTLDEAIKMDAAIYEKMTEMGAKIPKHSKEYFERAYKAYNDLSEGEGFTKKDARHADKLIEGVRDYIVSWRPSKEQIKAFKPVFKNMLAQIDNLDEDSKYAKFAHRWLNGRADRDTHMINKETLKEGGPFDHFAGEDGQMSLEEAKKMNAVMRAAILKKEGVEVPAYTDEEWDAIYKAYNGLSEGEGVNKGDMWLGQGIMDKMRDWRITDREVEKFYPMGEKFYYEYVDDLDKESKAYKLWLDFVNNGMSEQVRKGYGVAHKKYDKNNNGVLDRREWGTMNREVNE